MKHFFSILFVGFLLFLSCKNQEARQPATEITTIEKPFDPATGYGIVIHGGAGTILKENMTPEQEVAYKEVLETSIKAGHAVLENGGTSLEAIQKSINVMEDSPLFNAGKGAVFTNEGKNELDASIMDGASLNVGSIAGVTRVKNPINLAYKVMTNSKHVMFIGAGAEKFAASQSDITLVDPSYFYTERRMNALKRAVEREKVELDHDGDNKTANLEQREDLRSKYGTVGCVALDKHGNLAAGTSTGGMTNKRFGRVGDVPIIGAGTYANNASCAVSATGWGEYFIRGVVSHDIAAMMEYKGVSIEEAAKEVIQNKLTKLGGSGGIIAIDNKGNIAMEFNSAGMYRAHMNAKGDLEIKIYKE
ncbi:MAG: isoaspartyl peptidase/L-asparaginase [Flavobacteriaceae bacterium]|nr:isoaspartyl peptidase/L-asparaginase [Flavobacteriaceae bacterium]